MRGHQDKCPKCGRTFVGFARVLFNGDGQETYRHRRTRKGVSVESSCVVIIGKGLPAAAVAVRALLEMQ